MWYSEWHLLSFNSKSVCVQSITVISSHPECRNARNVERSARRSELGAQASGGEHTGAGHDIENPDSSYRDQGSSSRSLLGQMTQWWQMMANVSPAHELPGNISQHYQWRSDTDLSLLILSMCDVWQWSSVQTTPQSWSRWQELLLPL